MVLKRLFLAVGLFFASLAWGGGDADWIRDFQRPPAAARPQTWWHWMNNCVSLGGIRSELQAIADAGFGGVHFFNAGWVAAAPSEPAVPFLSEGWKAALRTALAECRELGLEFTAQNAAGWSGTGGPWIAPSNGMLVVTTTAVVAHGGETVRLAKPDFRAWSRAFPEKAPRWYDDIAVLAFPVSTDGGRTNAVPSAEILDLTDRRAADGAVVWTAPAGPRDWTLLRVGCRTNGAINDPSPDGSFGPVGSLFDRSVTECHLANYFDLILAEDRALGGGIVKGLLLDSWESRSQNWSRDFAREFAARRGYSLLKYLPTYAGYTVDSSDATARFKADARRTVDELLRENYFEVIQDYCRRHNLRHIVEGFACGTGTFDGEPLTPYLVCDVPMTEQTDVKDAVVAAHRRGLGEIAYEAHTGRADWSVSPRDFKRIEDDVFLKGLTRLVMHTYAHNATPERKYPGPAFGNFGACLQLGQTWWPHARGWTDYLARCQALLSRGTFVSFTNDLVATGLRLGADFSGLHRRDGETDLFFVVRRVPRVAGSEMGFRVTGKRPHLLDPLTGAVYPVRAWRTAEGVTYLPMVEGSAPQATRFVVFTPEPPESATARCNEGEARPLATAVSGWTVTFDGVGLKTEIATDTLFDWTDRAETRDYSGAAVYRGELILKEPCPSAGRIYLRLGSVDCSCRVTVDGTDVGTAWCAPYEVDVTDIVRAGRPLALELTVVNTWRNRLVADARLPPDARKTWTTCSGVKGTETPQRSGLKGPVDLVVRDVAPLLPPRDTARPWLVLRGTAEYPGLVYRGEDVVFPVVLKSGERLVCDRDGAWRLYGKNGVVRACGKVRPLEDPSAVEGTSSCNPATDAFTLEWSKGKRPPGRL